MREKINFMLLQSSIDGQQTEEVNGEQPSDESNDALQKLQNDLQSAFPTCHEQRKNGMHNPHMTLSHYPNLVQANNAKSYIESAYKNEEQPMSFTINEIYLLKRFEPDGQFLTHAKLPLLGGPFMPIFEEDWVCEERMKLKEQRTRPRHDKRTKKK